MNGWKSAIFINFHCFPYLPLQIFLTTISHLHSPCFSTWCLEIQQHNTSTNSFCQGHLPSEGHFGQSKNCIQCYRVTVGYPTISHMKGCNPITLSMCHCAAKYLGLLKYYPLLLVELLVGRAHLPAKKGKPAKP